MANFRIATRARANLLDIYDYTESKFGAYQADAYYAGLIRTFGRFSGYRTTCRRIARGLTSLPFSGACRVLHDAARVFYTTQSEAVEIRAVIHHARDIRPELFE